METSESVQNDIGAMIKSFESTEQPKVEEPKVVEAAVEKTDSGTKDEKPKEEPSPKKKGEEKPEEDDETKEVKAKTEEVETETKSKVELDEKDKVIQDLRAKLAERETKPKVEVTKEEPKKVEEYKFDEQDFVGDLDIEELTQDPKEFNKLLNKVYLQAAKDVRKGIEEGVLRTIPDIVTNHIQITKQLSDASENFYKDNKDLQPFKKVVALVFEEIAADNPGQTIDQIIEKVGPEVRKRLDLHKQTVSKSEEQKETKSPRLPTKGGKPGKISDKPQTSALAAELEEMSNTIGR